MISNLEMWGTFLAMVGLVVFIPHNTYTAIGMVLWLVAIFVILGWRARRDYPDCDPAKWEDIL